MKGSKHSFRVAREVENAIPMVKQRYNIITTRNHSLFSFFFLYTFTITHPTPICATLATLEADF